MSPRSHQDRVAPATTTEPAGHAWIDGRAGTVSVNCVDALDVARPTGGSGYGRDLSLHALDEFTGLTTTWIRHG